MRVIKDTKSEVHTHYRGIEFEGRPAEAWPGATHKGKQWIPDYAFAKWDHGQPIAEISLRGVILKQDGTPGQNRADMTFLTPAHDLYGMYGHPSAPAWLLELFADCEGKEA